MQIFVLNSSAIGSSTASRKESQRVISIKSLRKGLNFVRNRNIHFKTLGVEVNSLGFAELFSCKHYHLTRISSL